MSDLRIGVAIDPMDVRKTAETARFIESLGFDSVWTSDETLVFNSPPDLVVPELFPALTMMAAVTRKAKVGTAVIDASIRHPAKTAQGVATIDNFSGGRLRVGIGGGEAGNRDPFGMPLDHPFERMEEAVKILKLLFKASYDDRVSFSGRFYGLKDAFLKIKPAQKSGPPLIISAFGPRALRLAGELGDGWLSFAHTPESYRSVLKGAIAEAAVRKGRNLRGFETTVVLPVGMSGDSSKASRVVGSIAKDWLVWSPDNMKLVAPDVEGPRSRQPYAKRNERSAIDALKKIAAQIPDEIAVRTAIAGKADECVEQLEAFSRAGVRQVILYIVSVDRGSWASAARAVSKKVMPHFRQASR